MRYHIDTIPVWDAMKLDGECFLCALERKTELGEAERYLGASVMEPDVRVKVNDRGFCRKHHAMLFSMSNRLGHALMLESHTIEIREKLARISDKLEKNAALLKNAGIGDKLSGKTKTAADVDALVDPRGLPENLSETVEKAWKWCEDWCHTPTWYDLNEFYLYRKLYKNFEGDEDDKEAYDSFIDFVDCIENYLELAQEWTFGDARPGEYRVVIWFDN